MNKQFKGRRGSEEAGTLRPGEHPRSHPTVPEGVPDGCAAALKLSGTLGGPIWSRRALPEVSASLGSRSWHLPTASCRFGSEGEDTLIVFRTQLT